MVEAAPELRTVNVLLVEDDDVDAEALDRAFRRAGLPDSLRRVGDGLEALAALRGEGVERIASPYMILLDLKTPRMGGIEFLKAIREDPKLRTSIVFVFTTSDDERDISAAYDQLVAGYLLKQKAGEDFNLVINLIEAYWRIVDFPQEFVE